MENIPTRGRLNFELSSYSSVQGKEFPMYEMDRNAFTLLVMGYTGAKALEFKMAYIEAFDLMESHIREMQKTILNNDELTLIFNLLNFFKYLEHCKQIEERHKKVFIAGKQKENKPYSELVKQFYVMRNNLLEIGNTKELQNKYKKYCLTHPNARYVSRQIRNDFLVWINMSQSAMLLLIF